MEENSQEMWKLPGPKPATKGDNTIFKVPWQLTALTCLCFPITQVPNLVWGMYYIVILCHFDKFPYYSSWLPAPHGLLPAGGGGLHVCQGHTAVASITQFALRALFVEGGAPATVMIPSKYFTDKRRKPWSFWVWLRGPQTAQWDYLLDPTLPTGTTDGITVHTPWGTNIDTCVEAYKLSWLAVFGADFLDKLLWWCGGHLTINEGHLEIPDQCATNSAYIANTEPFLFEVAIGDEWLPVDMGSAFDTLIVPHFQFPHYAKDAKKIGGGVLKNTTTWLWGIMLVTPTEPYQFILQEPEESQELRQPLLIRGTGSLPPKYSLRRGESLQKWRTLGLVAELEEVTHVIPFSD
eukprot:TRINITY_DN67585_c3_g1_i1.p1 TRINITY_DN67585_c3_g1~~TRINITY_DN67585_c3_g1_i1.p1  ORF type:complete len:350 (-),score=33.64 TRINITY_DN67585_c3_g1_i1:237-1286(-)